MGLSAVFKDLRNDLGTTNAMAAAYGSMLRGNTFIDWLEENPGQLDIVVESYNKSLFRAPIIIGGVTIYGTENNQEEKEGRGPEDFDPESVHQLIGFAATVVEMFDPIATNCKQKAALANLQLAIENFNVTV